MRLTVGLGVVALAALAACRTAGNAESAGYDEVWAASLQAARELGYTIETKEPRRGLVLARRGEAGSDETEELTLRFHRSQRGYRVDATVRASRAEAPGPALAARADTRRGLAGAGLRGRGNRLDPGRRLDEEERLQTLIRERLAERERVGEAKKK